MTYHWTEHDIVAGRWVCRDPDLRPGRSLLVTDSLVNTIYQLGYTNGDGANSVLISIADGMVGLPMTKAQMAITLNDKQSPFRPCPHQWVVAAVQHMAANRLPL